MHQVIKSLSNKPQVSTRGKDVHRLTERKYDSQLLKRSFQIRVEGTVSIITSTFEGSDRADSAKRLEAKHR